jgi:catechol 2,3-dioxygenase-like lactoylglutathione lyase family enzyme
MEGGRGAAPFDAIRAAHAELLVTDHERSRAFYVGQLGLVVTEESNDAIYLLRYALHGQPVRAVEPPAAEIHREVVPQ